MLGLKSATRKVGGEVGGEKRRQGGWCISGNRAVAVKMGEGGKDRGVG